MIADYTRSHLRVSLLPIPEHISVATLYDPPPPRPHDTLYTTFTGHCYPTPSIYTKTTPIHILAMAADDATNYDSWPVVLPAVLNIYGLLDCSLGGDFGMSGTHWWVPVSPFVEY